MRKRPTSGGEDAQQQTVLIIQAENEIGLLGVGERNRSREADRLFDESVPEAL